MKRIVTLLTVALLAAGVTGAARAADAEAGKAKANGVCAACHAVGGDFTHPLMPEYPKLAGQHYDYIVTVLNEYKQGDKSMIGRKNPIMAGQAAALSQQDIENLATYLSSLPGPLHVKR
jgi:cytochrome c553